MSIVRPKILTAVTVPTGGWDIKVYFSAAGAYDTPKVCTVPAGTYFLADDGQDDDLIYQLNVALQAGITSAGFANAYSFVWIDPTTHKVHIQFGGAYFVGADSDVKLAWTESDSGLYQALGFDGSADDANTADKPEFAADWQHAYGWYADEDGQLEHMPIQDTNIVVAWQATALTGRTKSQLVGDRNTSYLKLAFLERCFSGRAKVFSGGVAYGAAPVYPYERNQPLECWWLEARRGTRFRVYASAYRIAANTIYSGNVAIVDADECTINATLDTDPQELAGCLLAFHDLTQALGITAHETFYINSHTVDTLTVANAHPSGYAFSEDDPVYIFRHPYQTYVIDLEQMTRFEPMQLGDGLDRFNISIPLKRYVA